MMGAWCQPGNIRDSRSWDVRSNRTAPLHMKNHNYIIAMKIPSRKNENQECMKNITII